MKTEYSVSVIVPVYNVEERLKLCVDSLIGQTLQDIEIILVDDGSADQSPDICDSYAEKDNRVKVIHLKNGGPGRARNRGIAVATGEFLGFADADDIVENNAFEIMYQKAKSSQSDIVMCEYSLDDGNTLTYESLPYEPCYEDGAVRDLIFRYYTDDHPGLYCLYNKLFRREMISAHGIAMDEKRMRGEDMWFVFDCLSVAKRVSFLHQSVYRYYQRDGSIMHTFYDNLYEQWVDSKKRLLEENKRFGFQIDYAAFYRALIYQISVYCRDLMKHDKSETVKQILSDGFYLHALRYASGLPMHIRLFVALARKHCVRISVFLYYLWSKMG